MVSGGGDLGVRAAFAEAGPSGLHCNVCSVTLISRVTDKRIAA
jgi:hypothetical protein